jgi:hypothetical protein
LSTIDRQTMSTGVSRRSALRGAAWTATAVTVVVATPNIAAASGGTQAGLVSAQKPPVKYSIKDDKHVRWDLQVTNTGTLPLTNFYVVFTFSETASTQPTQMVVTSTSSVLTGTQTWTESAGTLTATYDNTTVGLGEVINVHVDLGGVNNAAGTLTATFYAGNPSAQVQSVTDTWVSGKEFDN